MFWFPDWWNENIPPARLSFHPPQAAAVTTWKQNHAYKKKKKIEIEIWLELFLDVTLISIKGVAVAVLPVPEAHVWPSAGGPKRRPGV